MEFDFLTNPIKLENLKIANDILHISGSSLNKLIFVYSKPKVGSTCLVSSIRIFASSVFNVIHIHDEDMLQVLSKITEVTVNEIILYNRYIGKDVYVIDVYRSPIERKMSTFFEKIDSYHFNNTCEQINKYDIKRVIHRFNKLFPHLANGDHFMDTYPIQIPDVFDYHNKYLLVEHHGIKYIKLRLKDSSEWGNILTNLFQHKIQIIKDYETIGKPIKDLYLKFKETYQIPSHYLKELVNNCKYLNYYYSLEEKEEYLKIWEDKMDNSSEIASFTVEEYKLYEIISLENCHLDTIQLSHYFDEGCLCQACQTKRTMVMHKLLEGNEINLNEKIVHEEAKNEFIKHKIHVFKKLQTIRKENIVNHGFTKFTKLNHGTYNKTGSTKLNMKIL
uniref:Uncharacterized protein n=1 Tax=viral metagenome TaxID=1070528 RepID=A0A6C0E2F3_9ZZZZ